MGNNCNRYIKNRLKVPNNKVENKLQHEIKGNATNYYSAIGTVKEKDLMQDECIAQM